MDTKRRRPFQCEDADGNIIILGTVYDEGNCQLHWRKGIGWGQEQYHSISKMIGMQGVKCIRLLDEFPPPLEENDNDYL